MEHLNVPQPFLRLSLSVNFIRKDGLSAMSCSDLGNAIAHVNRVFYPAGISFYQRDCRFIPYMGDSDPAGQNNERGFHRVSLMDPSSDINVFIVPYIEDNDGTLGYTRFLNSERYIVLGELVSDGGGKFTRFHLGRFSNMMAHEIGHVLGLEHVPTKGDLMFPNQLKDSDPVIGSEDRLSPSEIRAMRSYIQR